MPANSRLDLPRDDCGGFSGRNSRGSTGAPDRGGAQGGAWLPSSVLDFEARFGFSECHIQGDSGHDRVPGVVLG